MWQGTWRALQVLALRVCITQQQSFKGRGECLTQNSYSQVPTLQGTERTPGSCRLGLCPAAAAAFAAGHQFWSSMTPEPAEIENVNFWPFMVSEHLKFEKILENSRLTAPCLGV
jgi:hypothetical protein